MILPLVLLGACYGAGTPEWRRDTLVADAALMACDTASTLAFSDGGRYDRALEANPVLGQRPGAGVLLLALVAAEVAVQMPERTRLPGWVKDAVAIGVGSVESVVVAHNATIGGGACGIGGGR